LTELDTMNYLMQL